jgi:APA family basic amino acid/polyamine antiporter
MILLVAVFVFWTAVNLKGVGLASQLNNVATIAKLAPLLLIGVGGLFFIQSDNLAWAAAPAAGDVARTSLILIFAFAGVECALVPSGEVRDPARTVPRAIFLAMIGITALYLAVQISAQGILGAGLATSTSAPLAEAAGQSFGGWARTLLLAGAAISTFGYLGGVTFSVPRMLYAFGRDGYLPKSFTNVSPASHSPTVAVIAQSAIALALAASGTFEWLAVLANVAALALYFGCALAAWKLRRDGISTPGATPFTVPFASVLPWAACLVILWLLTGLTLNEWIAFGVCVAIGSVLYALKPGR